MKKFNKKKFNIFIAILIPLLIILKRLLILMVVKVFCVTPMQVLWV